MRRGLRIFFAVMVGAAVGCTTHEDREHARASALDSSCAWIAGRWSFSGCAETECTYYQDQCSVHWLCSSPSNLVKGDGVVAGNLFTFGDEGCSATVAGKMLVGSCNACTFTATHR